MRILIGEINGVVFFVDVNLVLPERNSQLSRHLVPITSKAIFVHVNSKSKKVLN